MGHISCSQLPWEVGWILGNKNAGHNYFSVELILLQTLLGWATLSVDQVSSTSLVTPSSLCWCCVDIFLCTKREEIQLLRLRCFTWAPAGLFLVFWGSFSALRSLRRVTFIFCNDLHNARLQKCLGPLHSRRNWARKPVASISNKSFNLREF